MELAVAQLPISEAALQLGVSVDTVRRRIRSGELSAELDSRGRYLVEVPDALLTSASEVELRQRQGGPTGELRSDLAQLQELLDEVRRQRDQLLEQVAAQGRQLEEAARERAELRRLLADAQVPLTRILPAVKDLRGQLAATQDLLARLLPPLASFAEEYEVVEDAPALPPAEAESERKRGWWDRFSR